MSPATSQSQQSAAGMALSAKRGKTDPNTLKGAAKYMFGSMTEEELKDYDETDRKRLPKKTGRPVRIRRAIS